MPLIYKLVEKIVDTIQLKNLQIQCIHLKKKEPRGNLTQALKDKLSPVHRLSV